jgi:hypothetical protein
VKICIPKSKAKVNVHNLSDKIKILDLLKGSKSLADWEIFWGT